MQSAEQNKSSTRRGFLGGAALGGTAAAVALGLPPQVVEASDGRRRVVSGSPNAAYSRAVAFDRIVQVAGVVGADAGGQINPDFTAQCHQAMRNLQASVEAAGSRMEWVMKCTCFLTAATDFKKFNEIFKEYFRREPPARSTVVVKALVVPGGRIEIDCMTCINA